MVGNILEYYGELSGKTTSSLAQPSSNSNNIYDEDFEKMLTTRLRKIGEPYISEFYKTCLTRKPDEVFSDYEQDLMTFEAMERSYNYSQRWYLSWKLDNSSERNNRVMKRKKIIPLILLFFICLTLTGCGNTSFTKSDEYIYNLNVFSKAILISAADCESTGNTIIQIWHDSIFKEVNVETRLYIMDSDFKFVDFNTAIANYITSDEYVSLSQSIELDSRLIGDVFALLQNPDDQFSSCYDFATELYDNYIKLVSSIQSPFGNYNNYSSSVKTLTKDLVAAYEKLNTVIPDMKNDVYSLKDKEIYISFNYGIRYGSYSGNIENGLPNGEATFTSFSTDDTKWTYTGEFKNGHFDGYGTTSWNSGEKHVGQYKNDYMHGEGTYTRDDGSIYEGKFVNGEMVDDNDTE